MKKRLVLCCAAAAAAASFAETISFDLEKGERWWGGCVGAGGMMPFSETTAFSSTLAGNPGGNQVAGLFMSSKGRCLWSDAPFAYSFSNGHFRAEGPAPFELKTAEEKTLRGAHALAVKDYMPPCGKRPDDLLFTAPQWNTWIELTYNQNEKDIRAYADSLLAHGFPPCVIMIDDTWQEGYGVWRFNPRRFSDPKGMCDYLHSKGFKVMLWVVPYVSPDTPEFRELRDAKGLLMDAERPREAAIFPWWNGYSAAIDFSSEGGKRWFASKLRSLTDEYGVDGFKFDGGSMSGYARRRFAAADPECSTPEAQARLYGVFGLDYPLAEFKSTWQMGNQPLAQRLRDKRHRWSDVARCVPDMIAAQLLGYQYCAPDMIGGGEWLSFLPGAKFSKKLVVRYAQMSALMPAMQFSLDPWRVMKDEGDEKYLAAIRKAVKVRDENKWKILALADEAAAKGTPIVRPMEYVFPGQGFEDVKDQFVLGDDLIVAPVLDDTDGRTVRLPPGWWHDVETGRDVRGPETLQLRNVPLDRLPRWTRVGHRPVNYDESKAAPCAPPEDPLAFADGRKLSSPDEWPARKAEILEIFQREMFGRMPPPCPIFTETFETGLTMSGYAVREQIAMTFRKDGSGPRIDWLVMRPRYAKGPVPAIMLLNYHGNQTVAPDAEIRIMDSWTRPGVDDPSIVSGNRATERSRGALADPNKRSVIPVGTILARGYALVTACYCDVSPDPEGREAQDRLAYTGVFDLWGGRDPERTDNTASLMAWAWALSRGLDMLGENPAIDAKRVVVTGSSRLGKAALLAGAFDERFAVVVPNQTGGGGVPLARRNFGETIGTEMDKFTHWYCKAYGKYADNEEALTFDQHLLVAAVAPRPLLVEGFDGPWFDAKGEYLSCRAAAPVWKFLGKDTMPDVPFPDDFSLSAVGGDFGYVRRPMPHGLLYNDWLWMMDFADRAFARGRGL